MTDKLFMKPLLVIALLISLLINILQHNRSMEAVALMHQAHDQLKVSGDALQDCNEHFKSAMLIISNMTDILEARDRPMNPRL